MKLMNKAGFTIIEVMLFLSITGLLVIGILSGAGSSINIQRYRDSVTSLKAIIQQQYSEVVNVSNELGTKNLCDISAGGSGIHFLPQGSIITSGQSDCIILGKLIKTTSAASKKQLSIYTVLGAPQTSTHFTSDLEVLKSYYLASSVTGNSTYDVDWGSSLVSATNNPINFSILIIRSPISGVISTFINPTNAISVENITDINIINNNALDPNISSVKICVNSNGLFTGAKSAVFVKAGSASAAGVEILGEATSGCS